DDNTGIARAHAELDALRAWEQPARAATLLAGLGFSDSQQQQPVSAFSGGWRMRLNLAQVLISDADLMLLDEPTNHLDLDAILWLQQWLVQHPGALMLISHDRAFLDATVSEILHIEHGRLKRYAGDYSDFERQRAEQLSLQQKLHDKQQAQVAHMQKFIDRFRAKATKAKAAQSRIKALEKLERIAPAHVDSGFEFDFKTPLKLPNPMVLLENAACGYQDTTILSAVSMSLRPESRVGLLGPNGAGKTTCFYMIVGLVAADAGRIEINGNDITHLPMHGRAKRGIGYLPQEASIFRRLTVEQNIMAILETRKSLSKAERKEQLEKLLQEFHIDHIRDSMGMSLSGGERRRAEIARGLATDPDFILLDEPFAGVDPISVNDIKSIIRHLKDRGIGVLITDHNVRETLDICDTAYIVSTGHIIADGDADTILGNQQVRDVYLGADFRL
ncbi:MAG TPA: LPS export ABC transporter ATP-binding protein, partial [Alcanivorax sp.]|nr:LPS export ABC transporter ATP-binding protein [Alcanivorax sp.]